MLSMFTLMLTSQLNAQLTEVLYYGDIGFTTEPTTVLKKKEFTTGITVFKPSEVLYGTAFLKVKLASHTTFKSGDGAITAPLYITAENGEEVRIQLSIDESSASKKAGCFEILPKDLDMTNENHLKLAGFFGKLPTGVSSLTFKIGSRTSTIRPNGAIYGKVNVDLSEGLGAFQALKDEQARLEKIEAEKREQERIEREKQAAIEAEKRQAARDKYYASSDIVSIALQNTCARQGSISISTESSYTNSSFTVSGNNQSNFFKVRPGDKVYNENKLIHTVSSSSNKKVISFCPPKTEAEIREEKFQEGWLDIHITIRNSCSDKVYYKRDQGSSYSNTYMNSNSSTSISMGKDDKIWLTTESGDNITLIWEGRSSTQDGQEVLLCK